MAHLRSRSHQLLIDKYMIYRWQDRGIDWITDRFVIARADVFQRPPAEKWDHQRLSTRQFRAVFARARDHTYDAVIYQLLPEADFAALAKGGWGAISQITFANLAAVDAWSKIAEPKISATTGLISWWQVRRGKDVLVGVQMPRGIGASATILPKLLGGAA